MPIRIQQTALKIAPLKTLFAGCQYQGFGNGVKDFVPFVEKQHG